MGQVTEPVQHDERGVNALSLNHAFALPLYGAAGSALATVKLGSSIKTFGTTGLGRAILLAAAILIITGAFVYEGALLAILAILVFGLALPIYTGWKNVRSLAIGGLVILLLTGPLASAIIALNLAQPSPPAFSATVTGQAAPVLGNATVSPFQSNGAQNFSFTASIDPTKLGNTTARIYAVVLFVSTCPYDVSNTTHAPSCGGLPSHGQATVFPNGTRTPQVVRFSLYLDGPNVWWFSIYFLTARPNATNNAYLQSTQYLQSNTNYQAIEGPVVGNTVALMGLIIVPVYEELFLYLAIVFFIGLLVYYMLRTRRRARTGPAPSPPASPPLGSSPTGGPPAPSAGESKCPKCGAIVYANEKNCWKCGADLRSPPAVPEAPLPSGPS